MCTELNGREKGQLLLIVALAIVALVGSLALAIDGSNIYAQRRRMQNAADAGALAGARALAVGEGSGAALAVATEYTVDRNGADSAEVTIDDEARVVTVVARKSFPAFFASVIGWPTLQAAARANATYASVGAYRNGVFPIATDEQDWVVGESFDIFAGGGPGNFGWLGWSGCTSAVCLCDSLTPPGNSETYVNPYDPDDDVLSIGDWVQGATGIMGSQCVRELLDELIATETPITIVVWEEAEDQGANCNYRIAGFAKFVLEDYQLAGQDRITGRFIEAVDPGEDVIPDPGHGVYRVMLIE